MRSAGILSIPTIPAAPTSATLVFNYPSPTGFTGNPGSHISFGGKGSISGNALLVSNAANGVHNSSGGWYVPQQNITSFTTYFTFQPSAVAAGGSDSGIFFCVQNSNLTYMDIPGFWGPNAACDANGLGYGALYQVPQTNQYPLTGSIGIKFDQSEFNGTSWLGPHPSTTGLYMNGGPPVGVVSGQTFSGNASGFCPGEDMIPYGIDLTTGNILSAYVVYDGTYLIMVLQDTVTGAQMRKMWPVNIPQCCGGNNAWVGFAGGNVPSLTSSILTWSFYEGYNTRLATPTFNVASGNYSSTQTVTISGPPGATIYYTTNGQLPVTTSTQYSGPITVSANSVITAIAIQSGWTDSYPAQASYQIGASSNLINFPSGFTGTSLVALNGMGTFSGSAIQLTDTVANSADEVGTAWFVAPVNVQTFTCSFTLTQNGAGNGLCFVIQNQLPASQNPGNQAAWTGNLVVSGGINTVGPSGDQTGGFAYSGILNSLAVKFDIIHSSTTGLYTNGPQDMVTGGQSMSPVSLGGGHPLHVVLTYNGTTLSLSATDTVNSNNYSTSWTINIPSTVSGNTAYVGFTASAGGSRATQQITAWTYSSP